MSWHGYFVIEFNATLDAVASQVITALEKTGDNPKREAGGSIKSYPNGQPHEITHFRRNPAGRGYIVEQVRGAAPVQADITNQIASETGLARAVIDAAVTNWQVFAGADREARRQAAVSFISANKATWEAST